MGFISFAVASRPAFCYVPGTKFLRLKRKFYSFWIYEAYFNNKKFMACNFSLALLIFSDLILSPPPYFNNKNVIVWYREQHICRKIAAVKLPTQSGYRKRQTPHRNGQLQEVRNIFCLWYCKPEELLPNFRDIKKMLHRLWESRNVHRTVYGTAHSWWQI